MKAVIGRLLIGVITALAVLYFGDWAVWRARLASGGGMGTVTVDTIIVTPLKGNKEEYDWGGTTDAECSLSLFPRAGSGACWWLRRKKVIYER